MLAAKLNILMQSKQSFIHFNLFKSTNYEAYIVIMLFSI